jgi:hypothetical protein
MTPTIIFLFSEYSLALIRHPGEGRDPAVSVKRIGEIPAFAGMTIWEGSPT